MFFKKRILYKYLFCFIFFLRYVNCKSLAKISKEQVESGVVNIHPEYYTQEWYRWLDNIQDWCISRQLWWGHEIPAYKIDILGHKNSEGSSLYLKILYTCISM